MLKNISPVCNEALKSVMKCVNAIIATAKCERLFKQFYEDKMHTMRDLEFTLR